MEPLSKKQFLEEGKSSMGGMVHIPVHGVVDRHVLPSELVGTMVFVRQKPCRGTELRGNVMSDGCTLNLQGDQRGGKERDRAYWKIGRM